MIDLFNKIFDWLFPRTDENPKCGMGYWSSDFGYICVLEIEETLCKDIANCSFRKDEAQK